MCPGPQAAYLTFLMVLPLTRLWHVVPALLVDAHEYGALPAYFAGVQEFREYPQATAAGGSTARQEPLGLCTQHVQCVQQHTDSHALPSITLLCRSAAL
jgi:hypothetical protein